MAPIPTPALVLADRADDFLSLSFYFTNLQLSTLSSGKPALTIADPTKTAYIVACFPWQHVLEQTFVEETGFQPVNQPQLTSQLPTEPVSRLADSKLIHPMESRVAFVVPANAGPIPLDLQTLLQKCSAFPLSVTSAAFAPQPLGFPIRPVVLPGSGGGVLQNLILQHRSALQTRRSVTLTLVARGAAAAGLLAGSAGQPQAAPKNADDDNVTAIEIPVGLILSPNQFGAWSHATAPRSSAETGRTELWHTRLVGSIPTITATKSDFYNLSPDKGGFGDPDRDPPLTALDRSNIVKQSSGHSDITVNNLMLTSLGGWLDVRGSWSPPNDILDWRHIATLGRDHYVRVVDFGYLFPFGHRASVTKISERIFHPSMLGNPAYLRSTYTLTVLEHDKYYAASAASSGKRYDLEMPFRRVRITETVVSNLKPPGANESFCVQLLNGANLLFHVIAEDFDGNDIDFLAPLYFVAKGDDRTSTVNSITNVYNPGLATSPASLTDPSNLGRCDFHGRRVPFAENDPNTTDIKPGSTSFETASITFSAVPLDNPGQVAPLQWECHFYPIVAGATIVVSALKRLSGNSQPISVRYNENYLKNGFAPGGNAGQVFLELENPKDQAAQIVFKNHADRSGGLANPDMQVTGLSRSLGPVAGTLPRIAAGTFDPTDVFREFLDNGGVWLFGTIKLDRVLATLNAASGFDITKDLNKVPRFISDAVTMFESLAQDIATAHQFAQVLASAIAAHGSSLASTPARVPAASSFGSLVATLTNDVENVNTDIRHLTADVGAVGPSLKNFINDPSDQNHGDLNNKVSAFVKDLNNFANHSQTLLSDLPALPDFSSARHQLQLILGRVQSVVPQVGQDIQNFINMLSAEQLTVKLTWHPQLQALDVDLNQAGSDTSKALFIPSPDSNDFEILIEAEVSKSGAAPSADIYCSLRNFSLQLIYVAPVKLGPFVTINFAALEFKVAAGKSPDVNVQLGGRDPQGNPRNPITFHDPLTFINTIEQLISADGFSDPPALTVNAQGIQANYSIGLPNVGIGVFSLSNLSLGAGFTLPFVALQPLEFDFNFCSREHPFMLSVAMLGGGGYFLLTATTAMPHGVSVEASLDFGANVSVDLGVASGGAHIVAGIIFAMESDGTVSLTGFFKLGGYLSVIDLISLSIEIDLDLEYCSPNSLIGSATITVEVSVLTFSEGVQISCQKQFAGSPSQGESPQMLATMSSAAPPRTPKPPIFKELMDRAPWRDYCRAFA